MSSSPKLAADPSGRPLAIVQIATGAAPSDLRPDGTLKSPSAVAAGRLGGLKGGKVRAKKLSAKERSDAARKAALARWSR